MPVGPSRVRPQAQLAWPGLAAGGPVCTSVGSSAGRRLSGTQTLASGAPPPTRATALPHVAPTPARRWPQIPVAGPKKLGVVAHHIGAPVALPAGALMFALFSHKKTPWTPQAPGACRSGQVTSSLPCWAATAQVDRASAGGPGPPHPPGAGLTVTTKDCAQDAD